MFNKSVRGGGLGLEEFYGIIILATINIVYQSYLYKLIQDKAIRRKSTLYS